jgi:ABC-type uncharacterized transport system fused permease/ATPase subunit
LAKYRKRQRDLWSTTEQEEERARRRLENESVQQQIGEDFLENVGYILTQKGLKAAAAEAHYNMLTQTTFDSLIEQKHSSNQTISIPSDMITSFGLLDVCNLISLAITRFARDGESHPDESPNVGDDSFNVSREFIPLDLRVEEAKKILQHRRCTSSQTRVAEKVIAELENKLRYGHASEVHGKAFLITGQPGTGKSFLINTLSEVIEVIGEYKITKTSYMGGAAVAIGGETCCSCFQIITMGEASKSSATSVKPLPVPEKLLQLQTLLDCPTGKMVTNLELW